MHVLQVIPSISSVHGGPSLAMRLIEQALVMQGIDVETVTTDDLRRAAEEVFSEKARAAAVVIPQ